jgi:phenylacetate-CoA ligase
MDMSALYRLLPRPLQNAALTAFGYRQHLVRYGQSLPVHYGAQELLRTAPYGDVRAVQESRFRALIEHAARYVPHYRDLFRRQGIDPTALTIDNFSQYLPILSKAELVAAPHRFQSEHFSNRAISLFTSGTSGSPLPVICAPEARAMNYAFYRAMLLRHGGDVRDRSATLAGRLLVGKNERHSFVRKDFYNRTLYLSSYHLNDATLPGYIRALQQWRPIYIDSYPSAIAVIADYINRKSINHGLGLKFVLTSSETLTEHDRNNITKAFHCPVVDQYGCTEMAVWASGDAAVGYDVDSLYSLVEFSPAADTEGHSIICTGLLNFAMPLIRYDIGDQVAGVQTVESQPFYGQKFRTILGRQDDMIVTSDGRRIGRMDPAFKGLSGIVKAQIIQNTLTDIEVLTVPDRGADRGDVIAKLVANIRDRTSSDMNVSVRFVEDIPLTKSGKFKSVISRVSKS